MKPNYIILNTLVISLLLLSACQTSTEVLPRTQAEETTGRVVIETTQDTPEIATDLARENYLNFIVDLTCKTYASGNNEFMTEQELDAFARKYGYESMAHAQLDGANYEGLEDGHEYTQMLQERCPQWLEFLEAFSEQYS